MKISYRIYILKLKIRKLISWLTILGLAGVVFSVAKNLQTLEKSKNRIYEAEERVEKLKKENDELRQRQEVVNSIEFKEQQIRNKLGLVKEGEIIVILPPDDVVKKYAPQISTEETEEIEPNWKKWLNLFI